MYAGLATIRPTSLARTIPPRATESRGKVLIVDDDLHVSAGLARNLRRRGFVPKMARDGLAAAELLAEHPFDVVLTDIAMPGLDGIELLRLIRQRHPELALVLMTGSPTIKTAVDAVKNGAVHYLEKPIELDELDAVLEQGVVLTRRAQIRKEAFSLLDQTRQQMRERGGLREEFQQ